MNDDFSSLCVLGETHPAAESKNEAIRFFKEKGEVMEVKTTGRRGKLTGGKKFIIEGKIRNGKIPGKLNIAVVAFSGEKLLASSRISKDGHYKMEFMGEKPVPVELRLLPASFVKGQKKLFPGFRNSFGAARFVMIKQNFHAWYDLQVTESMELFFGKITKAYKMHGTVFVDNYPNWVQPLSGVRIDFYEYDYLFFLNQGGEQYLGSTQSEPDGSYEFEFDFSYNFGPMIWIMLMHDTKPDIIARISQFVDGAWIQVHESAVDWNIAEDFSKDYFVPVDDYFPTPESEAKPAVGFRPVSVGLLPLDNTRVVKGYASGKTGDPSAVALIRHQPFCGNLRLFGLFAEAPIVAKYKVQIATADEDGPLGAWEDLTDPLNNRIWDNTARAWHHEVLGPDENNRYRNIDIEPEWDWHEHALKFTWNSANYVDGYYALRIIGYDASNAETHTEVFPVMRVDNTPPEINFEVTHEVGPCGHLTLPVDDCINVKVTAYDPKGHMLSYKITGTRGKNPTPENAGYTIEETRPATEDLWNGEMGITKKFLVKPLIGDLLNCDTLAYNLELHVYGSPTNCYSRIVNSQHRKKEINLVVTD